MARAGTVAPGRRRRQNTLTPNHERYHQIALVTWARKLGLPLFAIPNGGKRSYIEGKLMQQEGMLAGVSDLFLPMPVNFKHGFFIEMKAPGRRPTALQFEWLIKMRANGYCGAWYDNWDAARDNIEKYLRGQEVDWNE